MLSVEEARAWIKFADKYERKDYFVAFIFEFICLEVLTKLKFGENLTMTRRNDRLKEYIKNEKRKIILQKHIEELKKVIRDKPGKCLRNLWKENRNTNGYSPITAEDLDDTDNIVEAVYWIRCNLVHGDKYPNREADKELVKAGFYILRDINRKLIKDLE